MRRLNRSVSARKGHARSGAEARFTDRVTTIARIPRQSITRYHRGVASPSDPPPPPRTREVDLGPAPLPLALELPSQMPKRQAGGAVGTVDPGRMARRSGAARRWIPRIVVSFAVLAAAAAVVVVWVLPWIVRRECVEEAAAHGITLAVDDAQLGQGGFHLLGVRATAAGLPGASAKAPQIDVETTGLRPDRMTVHGAEVTLTGSWRTVDAAISSWRASAHGGQDGAWAPAALVVDGSRVIWQGAFAENARVEASNVRLDVTWPGASATVHARSDDVALLVPGGKLGPWRVDFDRSPGTSRVRVALDPGVPDACTVLVVGDDERTTSVDVVIPRSPLARLGLSPALLGLHGKGLQLAATAHYGALGMQRAEATSKGGVYGIEAGLPIALDVSWDGSASGDSKSGLDVKKARLAVGPLVGTLTGVVKTFEDGFRVDLAWSGGPVPCAAFDAPLGAGNPFDVAYQLRKLAAGAGITGGVTGDVRARGVLAFDSRDLGASEVTFVPEVQCSVSLFGR
jgi:hypothetical protein